MKVNLLFILLNRIYKVLLKVNNESPFSGAVLLVSLLIYMGLDSIYTYYKFHNTSLIRYHNYIDYSVWFLITFIVYKTTKPFEKKIINYRINNQHNANISTIIFVFLIIYIFISLANTNREKITTSMTDEMKVIRAKNKKPSLEEKVRRWFKE